MKHFAWDNGAISSMFAGTQLEQKTIKTRCGIRVSFKQTIATEREVTCTACLQDLAREENFTRQLRAQYPEMFKDVAQ